MEVDAYEREACLQAPGDVARHSELMNTSRGCGVSMIGG